MPQFTINPLEDPGSFDVMTAAGVQSPGVCTIQSGGDREYNWDIKGPAPGIQGYTMTYRGWKAGDPIVVRYEFFEHPDGAGYKENVSSQIADFYDLWVPLFYDALKRPKPVDVYHPALTANDINSIVVQKVGRIQTDGQMRWWVDMTFLEFRPPKFVKTETPQGSTAKLGVPTPKSKVQAAFEAEFITAMDPGV